MVLPYFNAHTAAFVPGKLIRMKNKYWLSQFAGQASVNENFL